MWVFLLSPIGRRITIGAGMAAALGLLLWHLHHDWVNEGKQQQRGADVTETQKLLTDQRADLQKRLDASDAALAQLTEVLKGLTSRIDSDRATIASLSQKQITASQQVSQVPDTQLVTDLRVKLAVPAQVGPVLTLLELRKTDEILTDYPWQVQQVEAYRDLSDTESKKIDALGQQVNVLTDEKNDLATWSDSVYQGYVQAFNSVPRAKRSVKCLFLWKCSQGKQLPIPKPEQLLANRPKGALT